MDYRRENLHCHHVLSLHMLSEKGHVKKIGFFYITITNNLLFKQRQQPVIDVQMLSTSLTRRYDTVHVLISGKPEPRTHVANNY